MTIRVKPVIINKIAGKNDSAVKNTNVWTGTEKLTPDPPVPTSKGNCPAAWALAAPCSKTATSPIKPLPSKPTPFKRRPQLYIPTPRAHTAATCCTEAPPPTAGRDASTGAVCRQVIAWEVTPKVNQTRAPSGPTSTVTTLWCGPTATAEIKRACPPNSRDPISERRLTHFTIKGKHTSNARNIPTGIRDWDTTGRQPLLTRRNRSDGVTTSVRRMPNLSFTTTTSPCAIR